MRALSGILSVCIVLCVVSGVFADEISPLKKVKTAKGSLTIRPFEHATFVMQWNGKAIYVDPIGGKKRFQGLPDPDLILLTDIHGDHLHTPTVKDLRKDATTIVASAAVVRKLEKAKLNPKGIKELVNAKTTTVQGIKIEAIPMYNVTEERKKYHTKGRGNGYVVDLAGTRVYISGDTEDIPEMRALKSIDVAFLCMNLPYTMTVEQAASAVIEFQPKIVYPYHYRGQDTKKFKKLVEAKRKNVEVRLLDWYPDASK